MRVPHAVRARLGVMLIAVVATVLAGQPAGVARPGREAASGHLGIAASATTVVPGMRAEMIRIVLATARAQIGKPYRWGGNGPRTFDCSGLTRFAWKAAGVKIPRVSRWQYRELPRVALKDARPGDLVFFGRPRIHHVGIYVGEGRMIHAPRTGDVVKESGFVREFVGVVRPGPS